MEEQRIDFCEILTSVRKYHKVKLQSLDGIIIIITIVINIKFMIMKLYAKDMKLPSISIQQSLKQSRRRVLS